MQFSIANFFNNYGNLPKGSEMIGLLRCVLKGNKKAFNVITNMPIKIQRNTIGYITILL